MSNHDLDRMRVALGLSKHTTDAGLLCGAEDGELAELARVPEAEVPGLLAELERLGHVWVFDAGETPLRFRVIVEVVHPVNVELLGSLPQDLPVGSPEVKALVAEFVRSQWVLAALER